MSGFDYQAEREALRNDDIQGRADLMAADAGQAMLRSLFATPDEVEGSKTNFQFALRLIRELRERLKAEGDLIFLTEITTREEMREAVEVACDSSQRVFMAALDAANAAHPLPPDKAEAFAALRRRAGREGMDSPEMVAEREAWLDGLPTCDGCGK